MAVFKRAAALAALSVATLTPRAAAVQFDPHAFEHHPVRMTVGTISLVLAIILTIVTLSKGKVHQSRRERAYGRSGKGLGTFVPSYKAGKKDQKRYGSRLFGSFMPSYKGGKSAAKAADLSSRPPRRYRQSRKKRDHYGTAGFGRFFPSYRGRSSSAREAKVPVPHRPASHGGVRRYRDPSSGWRGLIPVPSYKGGYSRAKSANLRTSLPLSYKQGRKSPARYGAFRFGAAVPVYRGGKSSAGAALIPAPHRPNSYGGVRRYRDPSSGWRGLVPVPSYKGGYSRAKSANLHTSLPLSYKQGRKSPARYGAFRFGAAVPVYRGGKSSAGAALIPAPHRPNSYGGVRRYRDPSSGWRGVSPVPSYKGGASSAKSADLRTAAPASYSQSRKSSSRYGTPAFGDATPVYRGGWAAAGEARIPAPHRPASHDGHRVYQRPSTGWHPSLPVSVYRGSWNQKDSTVPGPHTPASHKQRRSNRIFGRWRADAPIPSYKGGWAAAKPARLDRYAPQIHRGHRLYRRLAGKNWCVPVDSYKGGYSVAGVGRPVQELPRSYKEPWGSKRRFYGAEAAHLLPVWMDGAPRPRSRGMVELPRSYKEPWGSPARYGKRPLFPIHMDGSPTPRSRVVIEPPMSYKEPWGSPARYGKQPVFPIRMDGSPTPRSRVVIEPPMSYKEPWGSPKRYGADKSLPPEEKHYTGGSTTSAKAPWQNPETGEVFVEHLSDQKRYGNRRYGGKLYAQRSPQHYRQRKEQDTP